MYRFDETAIPPTKEEYKKSRTLACICDQPAFRAVNHPDVDCSFMTRPTINLSSLFSSALVWAWLGASAQTVGVAAPPVDTCESASLTRPSIGVGYRKVVRNSDYGVKIAIPDGMVGWGGVAPEAPFHGFVVFLPGHPESCMGFTIQLRVEPWDGAPAERSHAGKAASVGNRSGWEQSGMGEVNGIEWSNVKINFSVSRHGNVYDGSVWLVSRTEDLRKNMPIFRNFVSQIRFNGRQAQ
jgi:hypothetical protein